MKESLKARQIDGAVCMGQAAFPENPPGEGGRAADAGITTLPAGERLLTIDELAERIQYSAEWIRTQVKFGRIPAIRFNARAWRFHWPTVLHALQSLR